jgi:hypothetical protein
MATVYSEMDCGSISAKWAGGSGDVSGFLGFADSWLSAIGLVQD